MNPQHIAEMRETMRVARILIEDLHLTETEDSEEFPHSESCRACGIHQRLWDE